MQNRFDLQLIWFYTLFYYDIRFSLKMPLILCILCTKYHSSSKECTRQNGRSSRIQKCCTNCRVWVKIKCDNAVDTTFFLCSHCKCIKKKRCRTDSCISISRSTSKCFSTPKWCDDYRIICEEKKRTKRIGHCHNENGIYHIC